MKPEIFGQGQRNSRDETKREQKSEPENSHNYLGLRFAHFIKLPKYPVVKNVFQPPGFRCFIRAKKSNVITMLVCLESVIQSSSTE